MRVLVVGDLMVVVSGRVEWMPRSGQNVVMADAAVHATGVAANVALNLRALDVDVTVLSAVGVDALGTSVVDELARADVDVSLVSRSPRATTAAMLVMIEPSGERTMVGTRGASARLAPMEQVALLDRVHPDWLHVSGYTLLDTEMRAWCEGLADDAMGRDIGVSVDLEGVAAHGRPLPMSRAVAFCNRDEFADAFGSQEVTYVDHPAPLVVKAGADGCYLIGDGGIAHVPTSPVESEDSTGAGDAFDAAFIAASLRGSDAATACRWGNAGGRLTAEHPGPRAPLSLERLLALL
jgi:ribokinase